MNIGSKLYVSKYFCWRSFSHFVNIWPCSNDMIVSTCRTLLLLMGGERFSRGDLPGDDGGGVKGRVNSSELLVLNKFL